MIVEYAHDRRVPDLVGEVAFAEDALGELGARRHREREQFDGSAGAVAVGGGIDGCHSTDAQQSIELPFAVEHRADPPRRRVEIARIGRGLVGHGPVQRPQTWSA